MLDRIMYKSKKEIVLIFTDKPPFTIYSHNGDVLRLATWLLGTQLVDETTEVTCAPLEKV